MSCLASCCASMTCGLCTSVASGITKRSARIAYCALFGVSLILSWILREAGAPLLKQFSCKLILFLFVISELSDVMIIGAFFLDMIMQFGELGFICFFNFGLI